jgi:hypothetical protein
MTRAIGLFGLLTVLMTWPLALVIRTEATPHQDVYFNMWRIQWFAHALATAPSHLFDTNIFYPERDTLALSDAMLVQGTAGAPFVWMGVRPVLLHNLLLLAAIALSGAAMFALARYLTGSRAAGIVAGIVFAFAPYRFEHIMHMELQWAMWMPLAFLALHRLYDTGRMKYGLALGGCLALQLLSSIYYGIFLAALLALAALLLLPRDRAVPFKSVLAPLAAAAVIALAVAAVYARPYERVHGRTGDRPVNDIEQFSARPASYLVATPNNWMYGVPRRRDSRTDGPERRLFPGTLALVLAAFGVLVVPPSRRRMVYLLLLVLAFDMSLGFGGYSYSFLYRHVAAFRGLRALARLGAFVLMFVAVLAAYGYRIVVSAQPSTVRRLVLLAVAGFLLAEYHVTLTFSPYANEAPMLYRALAAQPRGLVIEFPVPRADSLPGDDAQYAYMSTFHWFPLANGYSGFYPPSYLVLLDRLRGFPGDTALRQLSADRVRYVVVHQDGYSGTDLGRIRTRLAAIGMVQVGTYPDGDSVAILYRVP